MITPVENIMAQHLITVRTGTTASEAQKIMKEKRIRHLPVLDPKNQIVGVLSAHDLLGVPHQEQLTVDLIMSTPAQTIHHSTPLRQAVLRMLELKISSLLVSDDSEKTIGIVTTDDLLWHLAQYLGEEKEDQGPYLSAADRQTIGELANKLSFMGI